MNHFDTVVVGQIERPFGVKGEIKVRSLTDVPGRLETLTRVHVIGKDGRTMETAVTHVRRAGASYILGLAGVPTPEEARRWRGGLLEVSRGAVPPLPAGCFYECDLIGLAVQTLEGRSLGTLEEVWDTPANHLFVVRQGDKEVLIPAVKDVVMAVDLEGRTMTIRMLEGLEE